MKIVFRTQTLTPALSCRTGEGEWFDAFSNHPSTGLAGQFFADMKSVICCPLSHRMGEGQGEGIYNNPKS
jgi:hypothetical protein